jgi:translation elongation factor P/translation initiation factor 5A
MGRGGEKVRIQVKKLEVGSEWKQVVASDEVATVNSTQQCLSAAGACCRGVVRGT